MTVAALYVIGGGPYFGLAGVDPWDESRDARLYDGPHPVVAHPPCARWGRYWSGGPSCKVRRILGDDGGCFAAALASVRRWGGVLEHPESSHAWRAFDLPAPPRSGGWIKCMDGVGWTCRVEQGHYGHRARKATWLYAAGTDLPSLQWGPSSKRVRLDVGPYGAEERRMAMSPPRGLSGDNRKARREFLAWYAAETGKTYCTPESMGRREREETPVEFRDLLLSLARSTLRHPPRDAASPAER